jgi:hypothetical protein
LHGSGFGDRLTGMQPDTLSRILSGAIRRTRTTISTVNFTEKQFSICLHRRCIFPTALINWQNNGMVKGIDR